MDFPKKASNSYLAPAAAVLAVALACGGAYKLMPDRIDVLPPPPPIAAPAREAQPAFQSPPQAAPSSLDFVRGEKQPEEAAPEPAAAQAFAPTAPAKQDELRSLAQPQAEPKPMNIPKLRTLPLLGGRSQEKTSAQALAGAPPAEPEKARVEDISAPDSPMLKQAQAPAAAAKQRAAPRSRGRAGAAGAAPVTAVVAEMKAEVQITLPQQAIPLPAAKPAELLPTAPVIKPREQIPNYRPLAENAMLPIPRGDPSHSLNGRVEVVAEPVQPTRGPWISLFKVTNVTDQTLTNIEIFGDAGDHWMLTLGPGQSANISGLKRDSRFWGK